MRELAVRMLRNGEATIPQLVEELGVSPSSLHRWKKAALLPENNEALAEPERIELERLRRDNDRLRQEMEILKKFQAYAAKRQR